MFVISDFQLWLRMRIFQGIKYNMSPQAPFLNWLNENSGKNHRILSHPHIISNFITKTRWFSFLCLWLIDLAHSFHDDLPNILCSLYFCPP